MNLIIVKKFPLDIDLSVVTGFLRERGIEHHIYEEAGQQVLAVKDPRMVAPIAQFIEEVHAGKWVIDETVNEQTPIASSPVFSLKEQLFSSPVSSVLILLSILGAVIVSADDQLQLMHWFMFQDATYFGLVPVQESWAQGQWWRLWTPAFLHFGALHVVFNSLWMWDFGRRLERYLDWKAFLLFFVFTAGFSNAAQYLWSGAGNFGGMSGVIYGLVGFIAISKRFFPHPLLAVPASVLGFMLFWLVFCMTGIVDVFIGSGVANAAHLGGLIAGALFAVISHRMNPHR